MWTLLTLAARNLRRNRRRSAITMAGIALGLALMQMSNNIAFGSHSDLLKRAVSMMAGHVVVQAEGYQADPDSSKVVTGSAGTAESMRAAAPADATITRRLNLEGLLTSPTNSTGAGLQGIEPDAEAKVVELDERVTKGEWLRADDPGGILIGTVMAERLGVGLGDKIVFMGQPRGAEVGSRLFRVRGLFRTGAVELDSFVAVANIAAVQELYGVDDPATQIAVHLANPAGTPEAYEAVAAAVTRTDVEVLPWQRALPDIVEFVALDSAFGDGMWFVLGLIVALGVVNTVLMSVMERVHEFGVMLAVGMKPRRLALLVVTEALILGCVAAALGVGLGLLGTWPLAVWGLDMSASLGESIEAAGVPMSTTIVAVMDWDRLAVFPAVGIGFAVLASLWPAWMVTHMSPVEALRHQ
jgi:putative ABC transport system permease protein